MTDKKVPYGAWIDPNGDLIIVESKFCHRFVALKILGKSESSDTKKYPLYQVMYRLGYIRLTFFGDGFDFTLEYNHKQKIKPAQKCFLLESTQNCPCGWSKQY